MMRLDLISEQRRRHRQRVEARRSVLADGGLLPSTMSEISGWLRNSTVGAISSVPDVLNPSNPATQVDTDRQPTGNADGSITFASGKRLIWPLDANINNQTVKTGFACWVKQPVSATGCVWVIVPSTGGASNWKINLALESSRRIQVQLFVSGAAGRVFTSNINQIPTAGTPFWLLFMYDGAIGGDGSMRLFVNHVAPTGSFTDTGGGGVLGTLNTVTGNGIIGEFSNADAPLIPLLGTVSKNIYALRADITPTQSLNLSNFEPLAA